MDIELKETFDFQFKLIVIGDTSVGKSSIINRFLRERFTEASKHTVGVEFGLKYLKVNDKVVKLQIWDTAGQERFKSVVRSYYRGSIGVLIVYDITRSDAQARVDEWLTEVRQFAS